MLGISTPQNFENSHLNCVTLKQSTLTALSEEKNMCFTVETVWDRAVLQLNSVHVETTVSRLMVEGFVSHTELKLFVLISPDRSFPSRIQLEVFAFMKKYGGHFSTRMHTQNWSFRFWTQL